MIPGLITAALFALAFALLVEPRGRHHLHARLIARPFEREGVNVAQLRRRIEREVKLVPSTVGRGWIAIDVKTNGFDEALVRALEAHGTRPLDPRPARALADYVATCERATPEQLGAMSV